jgi:hypothetical protein
VPSRKPSTTFAIEKNLMVQTYYSHEPPGSVWARFAFDESNARVVFEKRFNRDEAPKYTDGTGYPTIAFHSLME